MRTVTLYFDFISPFAYIALHRLPELPADVALEYKPLLFAGLLAHYGQKGPAEIPEKRQYSYRWSHWWAHSLGIPLKYPAGHPFNPLHHLRLAIAANCTAEAVRRIFDAIWTTGADAGDPATFAALAHSLGMDPAQLAAPEVKGRLRRNTDEAIARGVFGVPTFEVDGKRFWGADSIDFLNAYLANPSVIDNAEMQRLDALPVAATRRT